MNHNPTITNVFILSVGTYVTDDYEPDRSRIIVNGLKIVAEIPVVGVMNN